MCGIVGFTNQHAEVSDHGSQILRTMLEAVSHRGPDESGIWRGAVAGLGCHRLKILDLAGGQQPYHNETGKVHAVFNGEIYNAGELRIQLEQHGHRFNSSADGEVLVHLYEDEGPACVERLEGMFAMAIWDDEQRQLLLARDRFGIKPLCYRTTATGLQFASEVTALLTQIDAPHVDPISLDQYLTFDYVPAPRTMVEGVHKLLPAHRLLWRGGQITIERYWDFPVDGVASVDSRHAAKLRLRDLLESAVNSQLSSDAPWGLLLSGGIDSSTLVALARQRHTGKLPTFSVAIQQSGYDESHFARLVAERFDTDHHVAELSAASCVKDAGSALAAMDEPLADPSAVSTYVLARLAKRSVDMVLGGDGGDELFAGYPTYYARPVADQFGRLPSGVRTWLRFLCDRWPTNEGYWPLGERVKRFVGVAELEWTHRNMLWLGTWWTENKQALYRDQWWAQLLPHTFTALEALNGCLHLSDRVRAHQYLDMRTYLQDDLLPKVDRMGMAHALEVRVPYLDQALVDEVFDWPGTWKIKGVHTKRVLRDAVRPWLPAEVIRRPKQGFGIPVDVWLRGPLRAWAESVLFDTLPCLAGEMFEVNTVRRLWNEHQSSQRNHGKRLWSLMVLVSWCDRCRVTMTPITTSRTQSDVEHDAGVVTIEK